jgi:YVTN family beta-propeller protein
MENNQIKMIEDVIMQRFQYLRIVFIALAIVFFSQSGFAQVENAYVTNFDDSSVSVISTATNTLEKKISVGDGPVGIVINSECTIAYVANFESDSISVINLLTDTLSGNITSPDIIDPAEVVLSPDDTTLYVDSTNEVVVIDASTLNVITTIPLTDNPQTMAITPDGSKLFVAGNNDYFAIDTATNTVLETINIPPPFADVQYFTMSPDGQRVYLTNRLATISGIAGIIISTVTNQVLGNMAGIPDPVAATFLGFVPNSTKAYLTGGNTTGNDLMQIYNPDNNTFTGSFFVGTQATDMAFIEDGSRAYVVRGGFSSNDLSAVAVVNTANDQLIDTINLPVTDDPLRITICALSPRSVPAMSEWGLIAMAAVLGIVGFTVIRRRQATA